VRWSDEAEDAHRRWRARELRVELLGTEADRASLREFLVQIAARLADPLRARFLGGDRVRPVVGS
jgi:hypothetical protein